jgi:hypothetical protein
MDKVQITDHSNTAPSSKWFADEQGNYIIQQLSSSILNILILSQRNVWVLAKAIKKYKIHNQNAGRRHMQIIRISYFFIALQKHK